MDVVVKDLIYVEDKDILLNVENIITTLNEIKLALAEINARLKALE